MAKINIGNKRPESHQEYTKTIGGGISADNNYNIEGVLNVNNYIRGRNLRVSSKGNSSAAERIDGELELYDYSGSADIIPGSQAILSFSIDSIPVNGTSQLTWSVYPPYWNGSFNFIWSVYANENEAAVDYADFLNTAVFVTVPELTLTATVLGNVLTISTNTNTALFNNNNKFFIENTTGVFTLIIGTIIPASAPESFWLNGGVADIVDDTSGDYTCLMSTSVNGNIIAIWASDKWEESTPTPGIMTINDKVMLYSVNFPVRHDKKFDHDKNENCLGGEIYITDNNLPPMYFNIKDIIDSFYSGSPKYFEDFDYRDYIINLNNPLGVMVFTGLVNVGGGNGRPVGQNAYSYRAVSNDGDRTNWSIATPMIVIPRNYTENDSPDSLFKYTSTRGGIANESSRTAYAPKFRLRVDNFQGYNYIEVKRHSYSNGEGLGYSPPGYIIQRIPIVDNQFSVIEIVDSLSNETDNIVIAPDDDSLNATSVIRKAEAIRYIRNKVLLANIEYESVNLADINLVYAQPYGKTGEPILKFLGEKGHRDPVNACYFKSDLNGEKESYSIILWNENLQRTFVIPIDDLDNFMFPDKRKNLNGWNGSKPVSDYLNNLHKFVNPFNGGSPMFNLPSQDTNEAEEVFEVVLHSWKSLVSNNYPSSDEYKLKQRPLIGYTQVINITENSDSGSENYNVRNPISDNDTTKDYKRNYSPVNELDRGINSPNDTSAWVNPGYDFETYNPGGYQNHYQSLGLAIHGISGFPDWVKAFSIAKTKPANRVIAQGIAVFPLVEKGNTIAGYTYPVDVRFNLPIPGQNEPTEPDTPSDEGGTVINNRVKAMGNVTVRPAVKESAKKLHIHIPDIESGYLSSEILNEIIRNPSNYKIQFVEPVGYYTEPFNGDVGTVKNGDSPLYSLFGEKVDMVTYAKVQDEEEMPTCRAELLNSSPFSDRYAHFAGSRYTRGDFLTALGGWLGGQPASAAGWKSVITNVSINTDNSEGKTFLEVEVEDDVWLVLTTPFVKRSMDDDEVKEWQEHFYIINIVNDSAEIPASSTQEYLAPINFIKLDSKIGISAGLAHEEFDVVDERIEDYKVVETTNEVNFVYVKKPNRDDLRFINITEIETLFPVDLIAIDSDIDNGTTTYCGKILNGKYKTGENKVIIDDTYSYTPSTINSNKLVKGDEVKIKYNTEKPISIFGGNIMHNDACFTYKHRECINEGRLPYVNVVPQSSFGSQFKLGIGFPTHTYKLSPKVKKHVFFDEMGTPDVQPDTEPVNVIMLNYIRQWIILYTCQARTNLSYVYGKFFPNQGYIERPQSWESEKTVVENGIFSQYEDDYPNEKERWKLGGFGVMQLERTNLDFSKFPEHDKLYARVSFLQEDNIRYCTRFAWSQTRPIQNYGSPSLKTFRPFNYKDLADKAGDIHKIYISSDRYGDNVYAMCENDICLVLMRKATLSDAGGNILGTTSTSDSEFLSQEQWQNVGAKKGLQKLHKWTFTEDGNTAFYANKNGVFAFNEESFGSGKSTDISFGQRERLINYVEEQFGTLFLTTIANGKNIVDLECQGYGFFDNKFKEYGFNVKFPIVDTTPYRIQEWEGILTNYFDITQCQNILFEIRNNPAIITSEILVLVYNGQNENRTYYFRKQINQEFNIIIKDNGVEQPLITLALSEEYFVLKKDTELEAWYVTAINKEMLELIQKLFVYCVKDTVKAWSSEFDYQFDSVLSVDGKKYGFRNLKCYQLEKGGQLNGENILYELTDSINPDKEILEQDKEFIRIQLNTVQKLTDAENLNIDFLQPDENTIVSSLGGASMKTYGGYGNYVTRNNTTGKRYQDQRFIYKISYNGADKIAISSVTVQYKMLK